MKDRKIHIPARRRVYSNDQCGIKLTPEAYDLVVDIVNEADGMSMRQIVSQIIIEAVEKELIVFDRRGY